MKNRFYRFATTPLMYGVLFSVIFFFWHVVLFSQSCPSGSTQMLSVTGSTQAGASVTWTNTSGSSVNIRIIAKGAGGGAGVNTGGSGAQMEGEFVVANNQTILAIAGGSGTNGTSAGAGGSGAVNSTTNTILLIAAGGGGSGSGSAGFGGNAATTGNGNGGVAGTLSTGGGGLNSNGGGITGFTGGGQVITTGLSVGGTGTWSGGGDGMGGGGGTNGGNRAGGGGHTGGGSGASASPASSYNTGTNQTNTSGTNGGGNNNGIVLVCVLSSVLPVELINFSATNHSGKVLLQWNTTSEVNNKGFQIERKQATGDNWDILGFQTANYKTGYYQFTDNTPLSAGSSLNSTSYYRLRQIDNDGKETLSKVVSVSRNSSTKLKIYPNPVSNVLTIETDLVGSFQILNLLGQQVLNGKAAQRIDVSALPEGTYFLKVGAEQVKFAKQ